MIESGSEIFNDVKSQIDDLSSSRLHFENIYEDDTITDKDLEYIYEGLFLRLITILENFLEMFFLKMSCKAVKIKHIYTPKVIFLDIDIAREIITGEKHFLDWLPFEKNEKRITVFFDKCEPFDILSNHKSFLKDISIIRNYIAHKSNFSKVKFEKNILANIPTPEREKVPTDFLRSIHSKEKTRFEYYTVEILSLIKNMTHKKETSNN